MIGLKHWHRIGGVAKAAQLLTAVEYKLIKKQRDAQRELLAILAAILSWRESLREKLLDGGIHNSSVQRNSCHCLGC